MKKSKNLEVTFEKAREWYFSGNSELKYLALTLYTTEELESTFKSRSEFPETWEDCITCYAFEEHKCISSLNDIEYSKENITNLSNLDSYKEYFPSELGESLEAFVQLLICRNTYWLLDNDWKPDYLYPYYSIITNNAGNLEINEIYGNAILKFRTKELCEKFYTNFEDLIEKTKKLI